MKYRKLANSDLEVSVITLGSWVFGGECWGEVDDKMSKAVITKAIEAGVNLIDTAPIYGEGRAEKVIGEVLREKRHKVFIATKCGLEKKGKSIRANLKAGFIRQEAENSLRRLSVNTIDLYQCHWPDPGTPLEETFGELSALKKEGKIRYIGISNFDKELALKASALATIVSNQVQYSILERKIEKELLPFCRDKNISILSYGPLGGGILTGKYKDTPVIAKGDVRSFFYRYYTGPLWGKARSLADILEYIAHKRNVPVPQVAINWVLSHPEVGSCIVGSRTAAQLEDNIGAAEWELDKAEIDLIEWEYNKIFF